MAPMSDDLTALEERMNIRLGRSLQTSGPVSDLDCRHHNDQPDRCRHGDRLRARPIHLTGQP